MAWTPSTELQQALNKIIGRALDDAVRASREHVSNEAERLSARGLGASGSMLTVKERAAADSITQFERRASEDVRVLIESTYGRLPPGSAAWIKETLTGRIRQMAAAQIPNLEENRRRMNVDTRRAGAAATQAAVAAIRDLEIRLAPFEIREAEGIDMQQEGAKQIVYNVTGANARVNVGSVDASTNVVNTDVKQLFQSMRDAVASGNVDSDARAALLERIDEMDAAAGTKSFGQKYASFMSIAANHMQVFQPFILGLSQLLLS